MNFDNLKNTVIERINEEDMDFILKLYEISMSKAYVSDKFETKKQGRIYVKNECDVEIVKEIIKEMDSYEYEYMPDGMVCTFKDKGNLINTGKFDDFDLKKLMKVLWNKGIEVYYVVNNENDE